MVAGMNARVGIRVFGLPVPQGSKTIVNPGGGRRPWLRDANAKRLEPWRATITAAARSQYLGLPTITCPVKVWVRFTFERPASHYGTGRNAHRRKDSSPAMPTGRDLGDLDKLTRAIFDAITDAEVWADDGLVVDVRARKVYAGEDEYALSRAGVDIIIEPLGSVLTDSSALVLDPLGEGGEGAGAGVQGALL